MNTLQTFMLFVKACVPGNVSFLKREEGTTNKIDMHFNDMHRNANLDRRTPPEFLR